MKRFLALQCRDVVVAVALGMFMVQLDASVLVIALPAMARDFGVPLVSLSLAVTIYLTMLVAFLPLSGWAADRFGPRRVMLWAMLGFGLFSLLCALAQTYAQFVAFRALMGISASLLTPVGRLIMLKQANRDELVDALAITAMPMLVAPTVGPSLGGFIVEHGRWEYIFLLNVPVALLLFLFCRWRLAEVPPEPDRRLDWIGAALLAGALIALLGGIDRLAAHPADPWPWALLAGGAVLGWLTRRHLRRHADPVVSLGALHIPGFRTTVVGAGAVVRMPLRAMLFLLPLMLQAGFGFSPFVAGLLLMALNGGDLVTKPLVVRSYDRLGFRRTIMAGSVACLASLAVIALAPPGARSLALILCALFVCGVARSILFTGMASLTFITLDSAHMSSGNVVANISMQLFNALSVSATALILGLSALSGGRSEPVMADYRVAFWAIIAIGLVSTLALRREIPRHLHDLERPIPA